MPSERGLLLLEIGTRLDQREAAILAFYRRPSGPESVVFFLKDGVSSQLTESRLVLCASLANDVARSSHGILRVRSTFGGAYEVLTSRLYIRADEMARSRHDKKHTRFIDSDKSSILVGIMGVTPEVSDNPSLQAIRFQLLILVFLFDRSLSNDVNLRIFTSVASFKLLSTFPRTLLCQTFQPSFKNYLPNPLRPSQNPSLLLDPLGLLRWSDQPSKVWRRSWWRTTVHLRTRPVREHTSMPATSLRTLKSLLSTNRSKGRLPSSPIPSSSLRPDHPASTLTLGLPSFNDLAAVQTSRRTPGMRLPRLLLPSAVERSKTHSHRLLPLR